MSEKRLETFVFEFENQEIFKRFWREYCHIDPELHNGIKWVGVATGNKLKTEDELLELIGTLYDIATRVPIDKNERDRTLEKTEKLLGIN
jgi:hypothetical protein